MQTYISDQSSLYGSIVLYLHYYSPRKHYKAGIWEGLQLLNSCFSMWVILENFLDDSTVCKVVCVLKAPNPNFKSCNAKKSLETFQTQEHMS
jgi:hypothetical protein